MKNCQRWRKINVGFLNKDVREDPIVNKNYIYYYNNRKYYLYLVLTNNKTDTEFGECKMKKNECNYD